MDPEAILWGQWRNWAWMLGAWGAGAGGLAGLEGSGDLQTKEFHPSALPVFLPMQWELGEAKTDG